MNHEKSVNSIKAIEYILKSIKGAQDKEQNEIKTISANTMLAPAYRDEKIAGVRETFEQFAASFNEQLYTHAGEILDAETAALNELINLTDAELVNAIGLVNGLGAEMPLAQQKQIASRFRGNYSAESALAAAFKKNGLSFVIELTDFDKLCRELRAYIAAFTSDPEKHVSSFAGVERALNAMLEAINSDYRVDLGVSEMAFMATVHAAAGLGMR